MRLVADIDAQHRVELLVEEAHLHHRRQRRHDEAQDRDILVAEAVLGAGGEGDAVLGAVGEDQRRHDVVRVAVGLQLGNDGVGVVGGLGQIHDQPLAGFVHGVEGARTVGLHGGLAVGEEPHGGSGFPVPHPPDARVFGVKGVDRGGGPIDGHTERIEVFGHPGQQVVGLGQARAFAEQPVAQPDAGLERPEGDVLGFRSVGEGGR